MPDVIEPRASRDLNAVEAAVAAQKSPFTVMSRAWRLAQGFPSKRAADGSLVFPEDEIARWLAARGK